MATKYRKFLLFYSFTENGSMANDWAKINADGGPAGRRRPSYKEAATLLKRSLHSKEKTKARQDIKVIHLYDLL